MTEARQIYPLLLCGGLSGRMGKPKHRLKIPINSQSLMLGHHLLTILMEVCGDVPTGYISFAKRALDHESLVSEWSDNSSGHRRLEAIYDEDYPVSSKADIDDSGIGPAHGLLAAHHLYPHHTFLVLACDYPSMKTSILEDLISRYKPPVTCCRNDEGFVEPLIGIWSSEALDALADSVKEGRTGPKSIVNGIGHAISIDHSEARMNGMLSCFFNTNTPSEWDTVITALITAKP